VTIDTRPLTIRVRMYQVGFGDCILLTTEYAMPDDNGRNERHILFDFGSTHRPREGSARMEDVARLIAEHTHGELDVVVVTHRHKDHLYGFGVHGSAKILTDLHPRLVLRPWTEDPTLPADASGPPAATSNERFAVALARAQASTEQLAAQLRHGHGAAGPLAGTAVDQLPNRDAIETLDNLAAQERGQYLHAGTAVELAHLVPGLQVTVLGPPTPEQYPKVTGQASSDPEYWMLRLQRSLGAAMSNYHKAPTSTHATSTGGAALTPGPVRWLVKRLQRQQTHSMARLVRALDDALNNTSLILLIEIGNLSLLFPGDAQIENWRYTLDGLDEDTALRDRLARIDLYKVGHHGSRNATPRSLHRLWTQRPNDAPRMTALLSTTPGVHGDTPATAVPRSTLVDALKQVAEVHSTDDLPPERPWVEVMADATGGPFTLVPH